MRRKARESARRIRQFARGVTASVSVDDLQPATQYLTPAALNRFRRMPFDAQRHSLNVLATLQSSGWRDPDLAASALLHDVGKAAASKASIAFNPWIRAVLVLVDATAPRLAARLAVNHVDAGWRYLLYVHVKHARIGAAEAEEDGCSALTCWLIAHHQDTRERLPVPVSPGEESSGSQHSLAYRESLLSALQWADSLN